MPVGQKWRSYAYTPEIAAHIEQHPGPWYVCSSTVKAQTRLRRRGQDCTALWVLMLDDIGTKATAPDVAPSIRLETSQDNAQWLYLLEPYALPSAVERDYVKAYQKVLAERKWTDPGATGVGRVFRVPGSVNVKPGRENFQTRIVDWHPERVWTFDNLMAELGVTAEIPPRPAMDLVPGVTPVAPPDPLYQWLHDRGRLGEARGEWIDVSVPLGAWAHAGRRRPGGIQPPGSWSIPARAWDSSVSTRIVRTTRFGNFWCGLLNRVDRRAKRLG